MPGLQLILATVICAACALEAGQDATVQSSEIRSRPRMLWADSTRLGQPFSKHPSVVGFGGRLLMFFSLPPYAEELASSNSVTGWSIGIAESSNLVDWKRAGELTPEQPCENKGL